MVDLSDEIDDYSVVASDPSCPAKTLQFIPEFNYEVTGQTYLQDARPEFDWYDPPASQLAVQKCSPGV
jgi:hypothetical protein